MARYVPQHLFDGLVVVRLIADVSGENDVFERLINRYRKKYSDDDSAALIADVRAAAAEGPYVVKVVQDVPAYITAGIQRIVPFCAGESISWRYKGTVDDDS